MSKIDISSVDDIHMQNDLLSEWLETFRKLTGNFPESIVVTEDQVKKYFLNAGEMATNFKGVPLEIKRLADKTETIVNTIETMLRTMHTNGVKDVHEVYRVLENLKGKIKGDTNV